MDAASRNAMALPLLPMGRRLALVFARNSNGLVRPDELSDLIQEASLAILNACETFSDSHPSGATPGEYARTVVRNALLSWMDARGRVPIPIGDVLDYSNGQSHSREPFFRELDALDAALNAATAADRRLIKMWRGVDCRTHTLSQVAAKYGISPRAARRRIAGAMERLRSDVYDRLDRQAEQP